MSETKRATRSLDDFCPQQVDPTNRDESDLSITGVKLNGDIQYSTLRAVTNKSKFVIISVIASITNNAADRCKFADREII